MRSAGRAGLTMVELLAVLALLGLIAGMSSVALAGLDEPREMEAARALRMARAEAIRTGRPVRIPSDNASDSVSVVFLPDGSARGLGVDPLTGRPRAQP